MDATELEAEAQRSAKLRRELNARSAPEVRSWAESMGLEVSALGKREEVEEAIERFLHDAAGKARLEAMQRDELERQDSELSDTAKVVHRLNSDFCRDIPQSGRGGSFVPEQGGAEFTGDYDVPNGTYRVVGSDWFFVIRGKKLAVASRATAANKYGGKGVIEV